MKLYIDKDNLQSLIRQFKNHPDQEVVSDCKRMIKNRLQLVYNFKKEDIDDILYQLWFNDFVQGRGMGDSHDKLCSPPFPSRPLNRNSFDNSDWETISSTYCCTDDAAFDLFRKQSVLISRQNDEISTLKRLFWGDYEFHQSYNLTEKEITYGWEELERDGHCLPCTDIMLADRYLLASPDNLEHNLIPLIKRLTRTVNAPVNLILFVERKQCDSAFFDKYQQVLSNAHGNKSFPLNVTIVVYPPSMEGGRGQKKTIPHDRIVLTNYRRFFSGPSFGEYFDSRKNVSTNGQCLEVFSLANPKEYQIVQDLIEYFQKDIIDKIRKLSHRSSYIFGAMKSNFFDFK